MMESFGVPRTATYGTCPSSLANAQILAAAERLTLRSVRICAKHGAHHPYFLTCLTRYESLEPIPKVHFLL